MNSSFIKNYYRKHLNTFRIQVIIPSLLALGIFIASILLKNNSLPIWSILIIGFTLIFLTSGHGHLHRVISKEESEGNKREIDELKEKANSVEKECKRLSVDNELIRHLVEVTNRLVNFKRAELNKKELSSKQRFDLCVTLNLTMLYAFYEVHSKNVELRIVFFIPSKDQKYLIPYLWYNHKQIAPTSTGQPGRYPEIFAYNSPRKVCESWRTKRIIIIEDAEKEKILIYHPEQEIRLKSMLTYPILNPENNSVTGIISIISNKVEFFKKEDLDYHRFIVDHFAARINFEYSEYIKTSRWEW